MGRTSILLFLGLSLQAIFLPLLVKSHSSEPPSALVPATSSGLKKVFVKSHSSEPSSALVPVTSSGLKKVSLERNSNTNNERRMFGYVDGYGISGVQEIPVEQEEDLSSFVPKNFQPKGHTLASLTTILLFGALLSKPLWKDDVAVNYWGNSVIVSILIYLLEALCCSTRRYLSNRVTPMEVKQILRNLQTVKPTIQWRLECYHYDNEFPSRNRRQNQRKVVTHRASQTYSYNSLINNSDFKHILDALEFSDNNTPRKPFLMISLGAILLFSNTHVYQEYLNQLSTFKHREGCRDTHTDIETSFIVGKDGLLDRRKLLAVRTVLVEEAHIHLRSFWLCTLIGLTIPYRRWFHRQCDDAHTNLVAKVLHTEII